MTEWRLGTSQTKILRNWSFLKRVVSNDYIRQLSVFRSMRISFLDNLG